MVYHSLIAALAATFLSTGGRVSQGHGACPEWRGRHDRAGDREKGPAYRV